VARIEALCGTLDRDVLVSPNCRGAGEDRRLRSLGHHPLRGVATTRDFRAGDRRLGHDLH